MTTRPVILIVSRLVFGLVTLTASVVCLLAYVPFTFIHFLQFPHLRWLTLFIRFHPWLYAGALTLVGWMLWQDLRRFKTRRRTFLFLLTQATLVLYLIVQPVLAHLKNNTGALLWGVVWLASLGWLAAIDLTSHPRRDSWARAEKGDSVRTWAAALACALYLATVHMLTAGLGGAFQVIVAYLVIFMAGYLVLDLLRGVARLFPRSPRATFALCHAAAALALAMTLYGVVFRAISFVGIRATVAAGLVSGVVALAFAAVELRTASSRQLRAGDGLLLFFAPLSGRGLRIRPLAVLTVLPLVAQWLNSRLVPYDWDFTLQKLALLGNWLLAFGCWYTLLSRRTARGEDADSPINPRLRWLPWLLLASTTVLPFVYVSLRPADVTFGPSSHAGLDVSFITDLLASPVEDGSFYAFLDANTNFSRARTIEPVDIEMVEELSAGEAGKPHIFLIVIDSLRKDYLSPYNAAVSFTPEIGEWAAESTVFENAFTRYGATGLSQPAIWVGGQMLSQQYVQPFAPMNTLAKLLESDGYSSFLSLDTILQAILPPDFAAVELEDVNGGHEFDLCSTLENLVPQVEARPNQSAPVFVYTQPQDLHISVIRREGGEAVDEESYAGFHPPYASRTRRMDRCFGSFLDDLRQSTLYADSIVILTSDHGDSLGEQGRWGHAYTIFPEILKIPLIIHLPEDLAGRYQAETSWISFASDVTPTLYYLLGHRPIVESDLLGRPLFTTSLEEQVAYLQRDYLVASSYGPVWGLLRDNGTLLYISDAVHFADYLYDLRGDRPLPLTLRAKAIYEREIGARIEAIRRFYGLPPTADE